MMRFWRFALLTLLIALLPLRGWAWAVMPVATPGHAPTSAAASAMLHGAHAPTDAPHHQMAEGASPCHGHPADTGQTHTCSLCDLCHASVSVPPSWAWFHDAPPVSPPSWAVSATPGRDDGDGLFRPPRA